MKKKPFVTGPWPKLQRHWDIRAACNFIGGGTGTGLLLAAAAAAAAGQTFAPALAAGLCFIACGLTMVLLEIGRPWRAFNVFFHPQTSWMTREGVVALPLFGCGGLALLIHWAGGPGQVVAGLTGLAALTACGFLYCQARILRAAKGIPAWREETLTPFLLSSGLTEGFGILAGLAAIGLAPSWAPLAALGLGLLRLAAWQNYGKGLSARGVPAASMAAIQNIGPAFLIVGHGLAALLLATSVPWPGLAALSAIGGLLLAAAGWWAKQTIVMKAAVTRGLSIPRTPVRGSGTSRLVNKPNWETEAA